MDDPLTHPAHLFDRLADRLARLIVVGIVLAGVAGVAAAVYLWLTW